MFQLNFLLVLILVIFAAVLADTYPTPFYRDLTLTTPPLSGSDVVISQNLLIRDSAVESLELTGLYDEETAKATKNFQNAHNLPVTGVLDASTADLLLELHSNDGYKDSGFSAGSLGYLYKVHIPVHTNRSIETYATLFDKNNEVLHRFRVRTHGKRSDGTDTEWPDYGNGDEGRNQFSSSGNTVTGLIEIDLNSPEPTPSVYGPWPVNRFVRGLDGNAKFLLPEIRDGILIHTGNWTTNEVHWNPKIDMPNSSGCVHAHPIDVERIYQILVKIGVTINENTFSGKNYPYKPQGIAVVELID